MVFGMEKIMNNNNNKGVITMEKDYNQMRSALACDEAEKMDRSELYEILLFGTKGYNDWEDGHIEDWFVKLWGKDQIPYK